MHYPHRDPPSARTSYRKRAVFYTCFLSLLGVRCGGLAQVTMWVINTPTVVPKRPVGAGLPRPPPIYRPANDLINFLYPHNRVPTVVARLHELVLVKRKYNAR